MFLTLKAVTITITINRVPLYFTICGIFKTLFTTFLKSLIKISSWVAKHVLLYVGNLGLITYTRQFTKEGPLIL